VAKVKSMAAMSRVSDADFILMAYETVKGMPCERVKIDKEEICTGTDGSRAHVKLKLNGHYGEGNGTGNGPVDAAVNAIREAMVRWTKVEISSYSSNALGKGSNAAARISMSIRKGNQEIEASAFGTDIVTASIDAFAKGYNAMCALEELQCIGK
jgi:D-citramalate synthase